jgi:hypothetical protein
MSLTLLISNAASKKEFNGDERDWRAHQAEETKGSYY